MQSFSLKPKLIMFFFSSEAQMTFNNSSYRLSGTPCVKKVEHHVLNQCPFILVIFLSLKNSKCLTLPIEIELRYCTFFLNNESCCDFICYESFVPV